LLTLREALTRASGQLAANPALQPTALQDAVVLLMETLAIDRASLIAHPERAIDRDQQSAYQRLLERRLRFEPIQYILGRAEFFGLTLRVTPAVLIPRPETELLVEAVLTRVRATARILDIGTGSGAIALALAHSLPRASITAVDLSLEALTIARENAETLGLKVSFLASDLLASLAAEPKYDLIVSNPPYVPDSDAPTLHPQVRDHEPAQALFAGPDGLEIYRRLIPQAHAHLKPDGLLALEIGHGQRDAIADLLSGWSEVEFLNDLQQIPRVALACAPSSSRLHRD